MRRVCIGVHNQLNMLAMCREAFLADALQVARNKVDQLTNAAEYDNEQHEIARSALMNAERKCASLGVFLALLLAYPPITPKLFSCVFICEL